MRLAGLMRPGRSALFLLALMLIGSALIRIATGPATAIAREFRADAYLERPEVADITPELVKLLQEAEARTRRLDEREAAIEARYQTLVLIETEVEKDIARLKRAEDELRSTMATADQAAESDLARLTSVYENMKAEQAAALFQRMTPSFAAGFLGRMRPDAAAAIFAGLEPDFAYQISVVLAGRNAAVPREDVPQPPEQNSEE